MSGAQRILRQLSLIFHDTTPSRPKTANPRLRILARREWRSADLAHTLTPTGTAGVDMHQPFGAPWQDNEFAH
jgi:hypothetical protein